MKRVLTLLFCVLNFQLGFTQELFSFTEPASNMPSKSIGFRLTNTLMKEDASNQYNLHLLPEIMVGVNRHFMFHAEFSVVFAAAACCWYLLSARAAAASLL